MIDLTKKGYSISCWPDEKAIYEKMGLLVNGADYHLKPEALREYMGYFEIKCAGSKKLNEEAKQYIPGGVQHNLAFNTPFPLAAAKAEGAYLYDVDGNRYVDYLQAGGPTLLGSNYAPVREKAIEVISESSPCTGLFHEYEMKLAQEINKHMPWVEQFRALASGTESDMLALRVARCYTGKKKIIKAGGAYHGWSDQLVYGLHIPFTGNFESHGIPGECYANTQEFFPNDIEGLRKLFEKNEADGGTAAVILEPFGPESGTRPVTQTFNYEVRKLCDEFGALLIFDEVVTGFRVGPGGAAGFFDIKPDLVVFGKIVAGGYPAAGGIGGSKDVMSVVAAGVDTSKPRAYCGGTLSANPLSCAAGYYAIKEIVERDAAAKAGKAGDRLTEGINKLIDKYDLPFVAWNTGSIVHFEVSGMMYVDVRREDAMQQLHLKRKRVEEFGAALTANGVITLAGSRIYTSMADDDETLQLTLRAFDDVMGNLTLS
ncbi:MAG: aminotransferase class III-fold pyridoxal phosphate-dependent enzyme [Clostridiales Family XIII bacterium]|jgi:glutamate-1-semialdehyde 2,1-aminomutase|nr:aminotransferase class III-fold pyridoxal phosphate-dependent enzyme [Clostridiales Family XIII bacterium]